MLYYDCNGKLAKAWGLGGLFKHHSNEVLFLVNNTWNVSLNIWGVSQGYLETASPSVNCLYTIVKKYHVATTLIIEPILLIKFQP